MQVERLYGNEQNNPRNLAIVEGFLRLLLQFHPQINGSGGQVDQAAKNKSESPNTARIGHHAD